MAKSIKVYGLGEDDCPYCVKVKDYLNQNDIEFDYINVSVDLEAREMLTSKGFTTVPQVWDHEHHIGGCDDTLEYIGNRLLVEEEFVSYRNRLKDGDAAFDLTDGLRMLQDFCHGLSKEGGWWNLSKEQLAAKNLLTSKEGINLPESAKKVLQDVIDKPRNPLELIALMHSELSEGLEGIRKNMMDDKLPSRKMIEVELADTIVRIMDAGGGMGLDIGGALVEKLLFNIDREDHKPENREKENGKQY